MYIFDLIRINIVYDYSILYKLQYSVKEHSLLIKGI